MTQSGAGAYLAVFLLMALAFIGIPGRRAGRRGALVAGLAVAAGCAVLAARYYRRRRARRFARRASAGEVSG